MEHGKIEKYIDIRLLQGYNYKYCKKIYGIVVYKKINDKIYYELLHQVLGDMYTSKQKNRKLISRLPDIINSVRDKIIKDIKIEDWLNEHLRD